MKLVAVTGGIATGKSSVCRLLSQDLGCPACSCDEIVHILLRSGHVIRSVLQQFPSVADSSGQIDRSSLARIVFAEPDRRRWLEDFLHPLVLRRVQEWIAENESTSSLGLVEVPLLYEVDFPVERDVDVVVACSQDTQMRRLAIREGSSDRAVGRLAAQMPLSEKISRAGLVIWNEGSLGTLTRLVALAARGIHQKTQ
ncbi:MAG: dephospho-CoA kinase [Verrucomicrobia bacterium]|jgi:dephospho-CoA kinase|nr:MAG: dephospho-CoA kinase [Verrucomicrobiota bacterium]